MAVNKNFVVKNGIEVGQGLLFADSGQVGVGTTSTSATLEVKGITHSEGIKVSGVTTAVSKLQVGTGGTTLFVDAEAGNVGVTTTVPAFLLDVRSPVSSGTTALFVQGDAQVTGDLTLGGALDGGSTSPTLTVDQINVTGLATFGGYVDINNDVDFSSNINVGGISTLGGYVDINDDVDISGTLNVSGISTLSFVDINNGDIVVTSIGTTNLNVTGVTTSTDKEIYTQFDITNNGSGNYEFAATGIGFTEATSNPTLYLLRGKKYHFSVNASGHPFNINTVNTTGTGSRYNNGVTNNGAAVGVVTFAVPFDAPEILHYNCGNHGGMNGPIFIGNDGGIGLSSEGTNIGVGFTQINFASTNGTAVAITTSGGGSGSNGIATVTFTPGVSLGLVIALGA
jgi:hypothetical protein